MQQTHNVVVRQRCSGDKVQAWVLVDRQLYGVPLRVPRCYYVDSDLEPG